MGQSMLDLKTQVVGLLIEKIDAGQADIVQEGDGLLQWAEALPGSEEGGSERGDA